MSDQGMRFKRIEVRNFGTWTGAAAHVFDMNRAGAVIAGENGAGKSTLLRVAAGIIPPTAGEVVTRGTVAPLIELGTGFDGNFSK